MIGADRIEDILPSMEEAIEEAQEKDIPELLRRIAIEATTDVERDIWLGKLKKKFKIDKRALRRDLNTVRDEYDETEGRRHEENITAQFPGLVDLVRVQDEVRFLVKQVNGLEILDSVSLEGKIYNPPPLNAIPLALVPGDNLAVFQYANPDILEAVISFLSRFCFLEKKDLLLLACYCLQTYLQDSPFIFYMAILLFFAVPERGKTRAGKALSLICYRGVHMVDLREANLFRLSNNLQATLFLDCMNIWKKAESSGSTDILLLRHEKGAKVARVLYPEKGAFNDTEYFNVFGPTLIATNEPVHKILDSRCLPISMPNKPGRYEDPSAEKALELKIKLTAFRAHYMDYILPDVEAVDEIQGRLWDISKPLLQICQLVCPKRFNELKEHLIGMARQRTEDKRESAEGKVLAIINELSPELADRGKVREWSVPVSDITDKYNKDLPEKYQKTTQWIGYRLKALGFKTVPYEGRKQAKVSEASLTDLLIQYGHIEEVDGEYE